MAVRAAVVAAAWVAAAAVARAAVAAWVEWAAAVEEPAAIAFALRAATRSGTGAGFPALKLSAPSAGRRWFGKFNAE